MLLAVANSQYEYCCTTRRGLWDKIEHPTLSFLKNRRSSRNAASLPPDASRDSSASLLFGMVLIDKMRLLTMSVKHVPSFARPEAPNLCDLCSARTPCTRGIYRGFPLYCTCVFSAGFWCYVLFVSACVVAGRPKDNCSQRAGALQL